MDWLIPIDQAQLLCGALGLLALASFALASFALTKGAEILGFLK